MDTRLSDRNAISVLWTFRWLVYELVLRDLRLRYRGSFAGFAWTLLNPLIFMTIYALVFSVYFRIGVPNYALYLLAGLIPWGWVSGAVLAGTTSIVDGRMYVGRTMFPTLVLPIVPVVSNALNFIFALPVLAVFALAMHAHLGLALVALPLVMLVQLLVTTGIVLLLATANVFFRDLQLLANYALTILFYLTPIFYTRVQVPTAFQALVIWNPFAALISAYQDILYANRFPSPADLAYAAAFGAVILALGVAAFTRSQDAFSQYI
ncbi:MAG: ABC transporter permease [bacterium]|nr:ABC transporter permease [bacterium]